MNISTALFMIAGGAVVWGIVAGLMIADNLRRRGEKVSFLWIRLMLPVYVHRYHQLTRAESGRAGPLFYHFVIAFNVALAAVLVAIAVQSL